MRNIYEQLLLILHLFFRTFLTRKSQGIVDFAVNVEFMNQSKRLIEPCNCSSQSKFDKKSHDRLVKKRVQNNRHHIVTNRSSEGTFFVSTEIYDPLISILILACRIGFSLILLSLLLTNLEYVLSHSRTFKVNLWLYLRIKEYYKRSNISL